MPPSYPLNDRELRALLGSFTHDLRNPLSAILSNLDFASRMAVQDNLDPDLAEALDDSVSACDLFRRILANLDVVAADGQTANLQETAVAPLVVQAVQRFAAQAEQAGLTIKVIGGDLPAKARLDALNFGLGVENLIANSMVHAPRGSEVTVSVERGDRELLVQVQDRGPAIPAELHALAVSAQGQTATGRQPGSRYSRGAALLAAQAIAELCGGALRLGGGDQGCLLTLALPLASDG